MKILKKNRIEPDYTLSFNKFDNLILFNKLKTRAYLLKVKNY